VSNLSTHPPSRAAAHPVLNLLSCVSTAMGNSKKAAKKTAAEKMVSKLQSLSGCSEITWVSQIVLTFLKRLEAVATFLSTSSYG